MKCLRQICRLHSTIATIDVVAALNTWEQKLKDAGVDNAEFNIKCMIAHVLGREFHTLTNYKNVHFTNTQSQELHRLCNARCSRMPLQYILGEWDFMNITLKITPSVFIPRPETEELVNKIIQQCRPLTSINMLEIGCGSGAMSLAILKALSQVQSAAIDRSRLATTLSWQNAKMLDLHERFQVFNHKMEKKKLLPDELSQCTYDLIISNPPYVKTEDLQHLEPEVRIYENLNALDGGPDGLVIARLIFDLASVHLRAKGKLWLELGNEHPAMVQTIINSQYKGRLRFVDGHNDQYKCERFVEIEKI